MEVGSMVRTQEIGTKPAPHVAYWEWAAVIAAGMIAALTGTLAGYVVAGLAVLLLVGAALYRFGVEAIKGYLPLGGVVVMVVAVVLGIGGGAVQAQTSAIEFTGSLAPPINGEVVVESAFNWLLAFASLVLAGMALRWAPRIARSMRRMG